MRIPKMTLIGLALAGFGIGGFLFNVTLRWLLRFMKPTSMVLYGGAICGLCFMLVAWMPYRLLVYPLMIVVGYSFYMLHNVLQVRGTEAAPNARVHANAVCHFLHVGARGFAHQRNRVDVGNLQREKRIGRVLDQLGGMDVGDDDGRAIRCKDFLHRLHRTLR